MTRNLSFSLILSRSKHEPGPPPLLAVRRIAGPGQDGLGAPPLFTAAASEFEKRTTFFNSIVSWRMLVYNLDMLAMA